MQQVTRVINFFIDVFIICFPTRLAFRFRPVFKVEVGLHYLFYNISAFIFKQFKTIKKNLISIYFISCEHNCLRYFVVIVTVVWLSGFDLVRGTVNLTKN
jgi:hypothetical protein